MQVKEILKVTNGKLIYGNEEIECTEFSRDTREIKKGYAYVGIKGESFDGNDFYKEAVPNPHLHIHVRPRYKNTVVINNHAYIDTEFAHHYTLKKESVLLDDDRKILYALMKNHFVL